VELPEPGPESSRLVSCPFCHTTSTSLTRDALQAGRDWRCTRCGQRWNARRLATVAAYAAWFDVQDTGARVRDAGRSESGSAAAVPVQTQFVERR
jgi:transcription elongation factor Elf1